MSLVREKRNYNNYLQFQSLKTADSARIKKWTTTEWEEKLSGFTEIFTKKHDLIKDCKKILCIGARTGQEVVALQKLGYEATGVDIVPFEPHVSYGDMHSLPFSDKTFDLVFSNVFDHSIYPSKKCMEIERVLKNNGICILHLQLNCKQDQFTEAIVNDVHEDVINLFKNSVCLSSNSIDTNFAAMNHEIVFKKTKHESFVLQDQDEHNNLVVPRAYMNLWDKINLPIQKKKAEQHNIPLTEQERIFNGLSKRAYFLCKIAERYNCKNIVEIGTAQGWQFFSFAEYCNSVGGKVWSCDIEDKGCKTHMEKYKNVATFVHGTSKTLCEILKEKDKKIDMFYIDGSHEKNAVLKDIVNLKPLQTIKQKPLWVFDDFDARFGCFHDISKIVRHANEYSVYSPGKTASNRPTHQLVVRGFFS